MKEKIDGEPEIPVFNESWESIRYFVTLMRLGSLNAAAKQLAVDHTTVGRRLRDFELRLGVTLFDRRPGKMTLTPAAREAAEDAAQIETMITDLLRRLQGADKRVEGNIRITTTHGIGVHWLLPRLQPFEEANPKLTIELLVAYNQYSSLDSEADLALSWSRPQRPSTVAKKLAEVRCSLFAAPEYAQRFGMPLSIDDLSAHRLLQNGLMETNEQFAAWNRAVEKYGAALIVKNSSTVTPILMSGRHLALLPDYTAMVEPKLLRAELDLGVRLELWISYDEQRKSSQRIRVLAREIARLVEVDRGTWFL